MDSLLKPFPSACAAARRESFRTANQVQAMADPDCRFCDEMMKKLQPV